MSNDPRDRLVAEAIEAGRVAKIAELERRIERLELLIFPQREEENKAHQWVKHREPGDLGPRFP